MADRGLTLSQYRELVGSLAVPSEAQMEQFADFVSTAHSWYKHLPLFPPRAPLQFFLDPAAGMQLAIDQDGNLMAIPRGEPGFHYSWLPTCEYRERFGYLAFSRSSGTSVSLQSRDGSRLIGSDDMAAVFDYNAQTSFQLPKEVLLAGRVLVSGVIHPISGCHHFLWQRVIDRGLGKEWPEESGGSEIFEKISERCRLLREDPSRKEGVKPEDIGPGQDHYLVAVDLPLHHLLEPERHRQRAAMAAAMQRMVDLVFTDRTQ